jgi:hypothetical protein
VINAQTNDGLYETKFQASHYISLDDLKNVLQGNNFCVVERNSEVMKVKIAGVIMLEFFSK